MLSFHKWSITDFSYLLAPREHKNPLLVLMMFGWCSKTLSETTIRVLTDSMIFTRFSFFLLLDQPVKSKNDHKKSEFANVLSDELMLYKRGNVYILENSTHRFLLEANQRH